MYGSYGRTPNPRAGANTPTYREAGFKTPLQGAATPIYEAGSRTPHYGASTPAHDGSRTPAHPAWDAAAHTPRPDLDMGLSLPGSPPAYDSAYSQVTLLILREESI